MRSFIMIAAFFVIVIVGCGKSEVEKVKPVKKPPVVSTPENVSSEKTIAPKPLQKPVEKSKQNLHEMILDPQSEEETRKDALKKLLSANGSQADFVVKAYSDVTLKPLIREVLAEAAERKDPQALSWGAALFESVGGEERIDFEVFLLRYGKEAIPYLVTIVKETNDEALFGRAADGLAKIGDERAAPPLIERLNDPGSWIVIAAAHALGTIGSTEAVNPLIELLKKEPEVASAAAVALGKIGDKRSYDALAEATTASNPDVRGYAAVALAQLGIGEAEELIKPLLEDHEPGVRFQANRALKILREKD